MNYLYFVLSAAMWSGSFIAIQPLVKVVPPIMAGALRIGVAVLFLSILLPKMKLPMTVSPEIRPRVWLTGFFAFGLPFSLLFWGEKLISPGLAGIINGTVPIWVFIFGSLFTPGIEEITARKVTGLALGLIGVVAIFLPKLLSSESNSLVGATAVVGMALSYAIGVLLNRSIFTKNTVLHPFTNLYQQLWSGLFAILIFSFVLEGVPKPMSWSPISTVVYAELYLGCISTSIAFMMFYHLIRSWGSVRASTVTYFVPMLTLIFDLVLNGALPRLNELLGVVAVTLGVVILNWPVKANSDKIVTTKATT